MGRRGTHFWDGQVAYGAVWDRALTPEEAMELFRDPYAMLAPSQTRAASIYVAPPVVQDTDVRVSFPTPSQDLGGGNFQEFRVRVRPHTGASTNPTARVELWEDGDFLETVIGTTTVSSSTVLSGTWDAWTLSGLSGTNVECKVVGEGLSTGRLEVGAIEWNAATVSTDQSLTLTGVATDEQVGTLTPTGAAVSLALSGVATDESIGVLTPQTTDVSYDLTGVATDELLGTLTPAPSSDVSHSLVGVPTDETIGTLTFVGTRTEVRVSFPTPTFSPVVGAGLQEFRARVRPKAGATTNPTARIELWENGSLVSTPLADTTVTTSTVLFGTWNANLLSTSTGANVECKVVGEGAATGLLEVGAIEWNEAYVVPHTDVPLTGVATDELVGTLTSVGLQTDVRVSFPTPSGVLRSGTGLQEFRARVRKKGFGANPLARIELWESGSLVRVVRADTGVSTETVLFGTWDADEISASSAVECKVVGTASVPTGLLEVGAIEWNAASFVVPDSATLTGVGTDEAVGLLTAAAAGSTPFELDPITNRLFVRPELAPTWVFENAQGRIFVDPDLSGGRAFLNAQGRLFVETAATGELVLILVGVNTDESVGTLTPSPLQVTRVLVGVGTDNLTGTLTPSPSSTVTRALTGVATDEIVSTLIPSPSSVVSQSLTGVATDEQTGSIELAPHSPLTGVDTDELVGTLTPAPSSLRIHPLVGIPTDEQIGVFTTVAGAAQALTGVDTDEVTSNLIPSPGQVTVVLTGLVTDEQVGVLDPAGGLVTRTLIGVTSDELAGAIQPAPGTGQEVLSGLATDELLGSVTPAPLLQTLGLTGVATDELVGTPSAAPSSIRLHPLVGVATDELVGPLGTSGDGVETLLHVETDELVGELEAAGGEVTLALEGVDTDEFVGLLEPFGGEVSLELVGVEDEDKWGEIFTFGFAWLDLEGVETDEESGSVLELAGSVSIPLPPVALDELTGELVVIMGDVTLPLSGLGTDELIGQLLVRTGFLPAPPWAYARAVAETRLSRALSERRIARAIP
jgi:hypothetical protein